MRRFLVLMLVAAAVTGCKRNTPPPAAKAAATTPAAPQGASLKGKILERLDASPYTYFRLQTGSEEQWAAVPENALKVGDEVTLVNPMPMANFQSKTLNRTFPSILFANIEGAAPAGTSPANAAMQHAQTGKGPDVGDTRTPKATGADARTVAEVFAQKDGLKEKTVAIRGKVVKFNAEILGRNWIHLRDGSGSPDKGDHDLTVTTKETAAVGDVVTVRGTLRLNKDFGSGYSYPVILEEAKLQK
jgi:hypothetical protein